jgi:DNA polymerase III delta subunit
MLVVFSGTNHEKLSEARASLIKKYSDCDVIDLDDLNFSLEEFASLVSANNLFSKRALIFLNRLLETDASDAIISRANSLEESENIFVVVEYALSKSAEKNLVAFAKTHETFDEVKKETRFNIFQITDAFGARDKKNSWVLLQKALREGISSEEILNILIWQVKNLLIASSAKDIKETGLAPFVFNKSKSYAKNFKNDELRNISRDLTKLFHESHLGLDLEPNLELLLLKTL